MPTGMALTATGVGDAVRIVKKYAAVSAGIGLIPAPFVEMAGLTGLHLALIRSLAQHYQLEFSSDTARGIVVALGAAFVPGWFGGVIEQKILRTLPLGAGVIGWVGMAGLSAVVTYGLGTVLIRHFEDGGTLLDFDVEHLRHALPFRK